MHTDLKSQLSKFAGDHVRNTMLLDQIIQPMHAAKQKINFSFMRALPSLQKLGAEYGGFNLEPDYQRGNVWTLTQKTAYVENVLRGVIDTSGLLLKFNAPNWDNSRYSGPIPLGLECLDGLQRLTAVSQFCAGEVRPFGLTVEDLQYSAYTVHNFHFRVAFYSFQTRAEVLAHYLAFNSAGSVHSSAELDRVRSLLEEALTRGE